MELKTVDFIKTQTIFKLINIVKQSIIFMKLNDREKLKILELKSKGYSTRNIAKKVLGRASRKSTVADFLSCQKKYKNQEFKIACLDIEISPSSGYYFGRRYDINIGQDQVISESYILSYSIKFLGEENIIFGVLSSEEALEENDKRLVNELYDILNDVDIFIAHNGKGFDFKVINTRLLFYGFNPPSPYKIIDTLLIARRIFSFPSNKLQALCEYLGIQGKLETGGFKMWKRAMAGDQDSLDKMSNYNINDVVILEDVYYKLRAWDSSHPNLNLYKRDVDVDLCPCCASKDLINTGKRTYTNVFAYEVFRCNNCGKIMKNRKAIKENKIKYTNIHS